MTEPRPIESASETSLLPISTVRFGWWLFLSAEMMMLAGVIGASLVLRSGLSENAWPQPSWVKSHWCIGMVTIVLLLSICWFLRQAQKSPTAPTDGQSKNLPWVTFALVFAIFCLSVIGLDYQSKISLGLFPNRQLPKVHGKSDLDYLSGVTTSTNDQIARLEQEAKRDSVVNRKLEQWKLIRDGLVMWTRQKIGRSNEPDMRKLSLAQLADQIYRTRPDPRLQKFTQDESEEVTQRLTKAEASWKNLGTDQTVASETLKQKIGQLRKRMLYLESLVDIEHPIRQLMKRELPKVIPGGPTWIANYWLLTGFLVIQLTFGTISLVFLVFRSPLQRPDSQLDTLQNVTAFWYFMALTGIIVSCLVWIF